MRRGAWALWSIGLLAILLGAVATANAVFRRDLYVAPTGYVCTGGSVFDVCYGLDVSAFSPPPPDLSAFEPRGFGYVEQAQVPGGSMYVADCRVVAVKLNGRLSSRPEFSVLSFLSQIRWALPLGILLVAAAGLVLARTRWSSRPLRRTLYAAWCADVGLLALYGLVLTAGSPLGPAAAEIAIAAFLVAVVLALGGFLFGIGSIIQLARIPAERDGLRIGGVLVGTSVVIAVSLGLLALHAFTSLWCLMT